MTFADLSPSANHLWQSTLFTAAAWALTLTLRANRAAVRYWLWLAASVKFLIPFALLVSAGGLLGWRTAPAIDPPQWSFVVGQITQPFVAAAPAPQVVAPAPSSPIPAVLLSVWLCGVAAGIVFWFRCWRRMRAARRAAIPLPLNLPIPAMSSATRLEPGVFGIYHPVLLLPEGIAERLTPPQMELVIAHELCHVRRRDNLSAAIHMLVETIFWFHPLVWWIRARLVEERERACDEEVLRMAADPNTYAEGILNVCRFYLSSPLACASGVTGADLKRRIAAIVAHRSAPALNTSRKILLVAAGAVALFAPIAVGMLGALPSRGQTQAGTPPPAFEAASVKPNRGTGRRERTRSIEPGRITYLDTTLGEFIAMACGVKHYQISGPDWIVNLSSSDTYDIIATAGKAVSVAEVKRMLGPLLADRFHLAFHRETRELPVFALLLAKGGPKFKQPGDGLPSGIKPDGEGGLSFKNWSMENLADWLTLLPSIGRPVVDRTGLAGSFSFHANLLNLDKGTPPDDMKRAMESSDSGDILRAMLPRELGLRLETQKAPIETVVIDHADKLPTEN